MGLLALFLVTTLLVAPWVAMTGTLNYINRLEWQRKLRNDERRIALINSL
jgi:hypothetical protein